MLFTVNKDLKYNWTLKQEENFTFSAPLFVTNNCSHLATLFVSYIKCVLGTFNLHDISDFLAHFKCFTAKASGCRESCLPGAA